MPDLVLVDFDDTLVETAPAFQQAREALFLRLEEEGFPREEARAIHHEEVEPELLTVFGMGPFRMEPSFRETYLRLCQKEGRTPDSAVSTRPTSDATTTRPRSVKPWPRHLPTGW